MTTKDKQIALRLEEVYVDRADALVPIMESIPEMAAMRVTRAAVLRLAIMRGLDALEAQYQPGEKGEGARAKSDGGG